MKKKSPHPALRIAVPVVALTLLVSAIAVGNLNPTAPEGVDVYFEEVGATIDSVPYRVGGWIGTDLDSAPPQVLDTLRPTRVLHRGYVDGGERCRVVMVHCPDVRDMQGHYPARCYPATGWEEIRKETVKAPLAGGEHDVTVYTFERLGDYGERIRLTVAVFFALPTHDAAENQSAIYADLKGVRDASANRRRNLLGSAQLQVIFDRDCPMEEVRRVLGELSPALNPVIRTVAEGLN